ncbi:MAG TPA: hypothetical protein VFS56_02185, partial [Gemmatimonadaceae bacterium]|nr:hypothetical protein [Gemmatimonadaceae bacterium]
QVSRAKKVLIITGRGNNSPGQVSPVREAIQALFPLLRRRGVIAAWEEHTAGSFVVSLAPVSALLYAPRRKRDRSRGASPVAASLEGLEPSTLDLLRRLALRSLELLGARVPEKFLEAEMLSTFSSLAAGIPPGADGEQHLRDAIIAALDQLDT